jgi:serine/threonine protein kinase
MTGQTLSHYRITRKLGAGGMGVVHEALDLKLDRPVAIKLPPEEFAASPDWLTRFEREARLLASFSHPHIAAVLALLPDRSMAPSRPIRMRTLTFSGRGCSPSASRGQRTSMAAASGNTCVGR